MILGVTAAFLLSRKKFWGRDMVEVALSLPLVLPPIVLGYYLPSCMAGLLDIQKRFNSPVMLISHAPNVDIFAETLVVYDAGKVNAVVANYQTKKASGNSGVMMPWQSCTA